MLSKFAGASLFLSSYMPLFAILSVENVGIHNGLMYAFAALAILGVFGVTFIIYNSRRDSTAIPDRIITCHEHGDEVMAYVSAYLIPFIGLDFSDWRHIIALVTFLILLGYLYVTTSMIYINPLLRPLGYHVYAVELERCGSQRIITKHSLAPNDSVEVVRLVDRVVIEGNKP